MRDPKSGSRIWVGLAVMVACIAGTIAFRPGGMLRGHWDERREARERQDKVAALWETIIDGPHLDGAELEPLVVVFTNYECPYCRIGDRFIGTLMDESPEMGVVVRPYGTSRYPQSIPAAAAALCADDQGQFPAMHRQLFASAEWRISGEFVEEARRAGLRDLQLFSVCMGGEGVAHRIRDTRFLAREIGVSGTPGYVFPTGVVKLGANLEELGEEIGR